MEKPNQIVKSLSWVVVLVILHTHLCSFRCSIGLFACCNEGDTEEPVQKSGSCHHEDSSGNCQGNHLAFFKTIGQYHFLQADTVTDLQSLIAVLFSDQIFYPKDIFHTAEIYTGFHPPPPKAGTRIIIQSFQI